MDNQQIFNILEKKLKNNDLHIIEKIKGYLFICMGCKKIEPPTSDFDTEICESCAANLRLTFSFYTMKDTDISLEELFNLVSGNEYINSMTVQDRYKRSKIIDYITTLQMKSWGTEKINIVFNIAHKLCEYDENIKKRRKRRKLRL